MVETAEILVDNGLKLGGIATGDYAHLGRILLETIPDDRKQQWAGKVMAYIAQQTMNSTSIDNSPPRITTKAIHSDLGGNPNLEPSAWLSKLWGDIERRFYPEIEAALIEKCKAAGLNIYPAIEKDGGKPAYYRLVSKAIPQERSDVEAAAPGNNPSPSVIHYQKDLNLRLSTAGRIFFGEGMKWTPLKRYGYLAVKLALLLAVGIITGLLWVTLCYRDKPVTGLDLVLLATAIGFPWWAYRHVSDVWQLFDDRITIAPDWMLTWKEFGATVEITRSKNPDTPSEIHVNRYTATCAICARMVKLDHGEPDFPRRIVGRCEENPREHVFSFDRSTKLGASLRPLLQNP